MSRNAALSSNTRLPAARARRACLVVGLCTALSIASQGPARGQDAPRPQEAQAPRTFAFDIGPQPLAAALMAFGRQAGLQVVVDASAVAGLSSGGLAGSMSADRALQQMLAGSGLIYRFTNANTVAVERPGASTAPGAMQLDPVRVQGMFPVPPQAMIDNAPPPYAGGQVATGGQLGLLGNRGVMDTPFNQTNYTAKLLQDQQATTVRDVLLDDPSVRFTNADGGITNDGFRIRGFAVTNQDISYGGLYGILPYTTVMAELAERVEILKGPSAMLNGMTPQGVIGGTVNIVPKRAPDEGLIQGTVNYISPGQVGGHIDFARRFGDEKQFGVRVNGVFRAGQTEVENNVDQRGLGILGLDFRGEHVRLSGDFGYQSQYTNGVIPQLALASGVPLPWAPSARENQGQPWTYSQRKDLFGVVRAELDMTEWMTAYAAIGVRDSIVTGLDVFRVTMTNFNGAALGLALEKWVEQWMALTVDAGIRARVDTGPIGHEFAVTATTLERDFSFGSGTGVAPAYATNIYNPTVVAHPSFTIPVAQKTSTQGLSNLGFADTLSAADKRIQLTAGLRFQNVSAQNFNTTTGQPTTGYDQSAVSPAVALVLKPWQNLSVYVNFIQGLQPGTIVGAGFANVGEVFPPFKSTQYEAGVKVDWGRFTTTVSAFQISQPSILTNVATNTQFLGGEQRNQGVELNVFGEPTEGVRLLGGVMFLSPVLAKTQGGLTDGWIAPLSPQFNLNIYGELDLPFVRGLTLNSRVIYTSSQYVDTTWPRRSLPEWTRFDLGARYAFENPGAKGKLLVARLNVDNVLDANYWAGGGGVSALFLGQPRTFRLSLTADF